MVKIEIDGNVLALSPSQKIRFKLRNQMMFEDVLPKYYSFPFTISLDKGTNSFLLKYPQFWNNKIKLSRKLNCLVYLFGETNPRKSILNINTVSENSCECNIVVDKNVDDIGDKKLSDIDMGTVVLNSTVYHEVRMTLFSFYNSGSTTAAINFQLSINGHMFEYSSIYSESDLSRSTAFITMINAADIGVTAYYLTGSFFLKSNIPGSTGVFTLDNIQEVSDRFFASDGASHATDEYYWDIDFMDAWIDDHISEINNSISALITSYNTNSLVTLPIIENIGFFDDPDSYVGFQNGLLGATITDKNKYTFITPMLHFLFVLKNVFKFIGYDAFGSFFEDENIKRFILYSNVASDCFVPYYSGSGNPYNNPEEYTGRKINIHSNVITLSRNTPDVTVKEFLTEIRKFFNLRFDYNHQNATVEVYISQTNADNLIQNAKDLTDKIVNKWQLQNPTNTNDTVKLFAFEVDSSDLKTKQLGVLDYQLPLVIDKNAKKEITPKISSIAEEMVGGFSQVPVVQIAGVYNNQGTAAKIKLLQYYGQYNNALVATAPDWAKHTPISGSIAVPFAFNKDSYPNFAYTSNWSLRWDTEKGIYKKCWEKQTQLLNDGVQLKIAMTFTSADLLQLEENPYHILDGSVAIWKELDIELGSDTLPPAECIYQLL